MKAYLNFILISCLLFNCVGTDTVDDLIPEKLEITNPIMSLEVGASYDFL